MLLFSGKVRELTLTLALALADLVEGPVVVSPSASGTSSHHILLLFSSPSQQPDRKGGAISYQSAEESADGACSLAESAIFLEEKRNEVMCLRWALQARWRLCLCCS